MHSSKDFDVSGLTAVGIVISVVLCLAIGFSVLSAWLFDGHEQECVTASMFETDCVVCEQGVSCNWEKTNMGTWFEYHSELIRRQKEAQAEKQKFMGV